MKKHLSLTNICQQKKFNKKICFLGHKQLNFELKPKQPNLDRIKNLFKMDVAK